MALRWAKSRRASATHSRAGSKFAKTQLQLARAALAPQTNAHNYTQLISAAQSSSASCQESKQSAMNTSKATSQRDDCKFGQPKRRPLYWLALGRLLSARAFYDA